ncbi:MAG TPA: ABC transporter ATP-binding protein [Bacteroidia bacterium]|nr:ABC transporter ATP-binding protein [Bacteroidia bacterium]
MATITGKAFDFPILKRVFTFVAPYRKTFYLTVFLTLLIAGISPLRPWLTQITLDKYVAVSDSEMLLWMTLLMFGILLLQSAMQFYHNYMVNLLGQQVVKDMRVKLYSTILNFRLKYFDTTPIGTLVTREISDMETIADIFSEGLIIIIGDIITLLVIIAFMFFTDWRLTLISLSAIPFLVIATRIFQNKIKDAFKDVRTQVAHLNTFVQEHLTGMKIVQMFNREEEEMKRFDKINIAHRDANIRSVWYYSIFFPVVEILSAISIGLLVWWGAHGVIKGMTSFGNLVAFIMYINLLFRPIRELADKFNTLQMGMVSSERIFKILDEPAAVSHNKGTIPADAVKGSIVFKNVWFSYDDENAEWILKDVSFEVDAGSTVAFVGATGAGKTTIINLLNRFYEIKKGSILLDGVDIREYELYSLRSKIGLVLQDVFLFSDSIANNISLNNPGITMKQIREGAERVGAESFIEKLPGTYDFNVQERGGMLSMGQRQLISFIRAYVYDPRILILDEATSSIDSESEELIIKATKVLTENRTSLVIAHRLATVQNADKIIVLDHGEIKETGTHQELLKKSGLYKQLYEIQFKRLAEA